MWLHPGHLSVAGGADRVVFLEIPAPVQTGNRFLPCCELR